MNVSVSFWHEALDKGKTIKELKTSGSERDVMIANTIEKVCEQLYIEYPVVTIGLPIKDENGTCYGVAFSPQAHPNAGINNNIIYLGIVNQILKKEDIEFLVAHELRHIWQDSFYHKKYRAPGVFLLLVFAFASEYKYKRFKSFYTKAEIDADVFAVAWIAKEYDEKIDNVAQSVMNDIDMESKLAYKIRLWKARRIIATNQFCGS